MRRVLCSILIMFFLVPLTTIGQDKSDWVVFKKDNYSLMHPADYDVNTTGHAGTEFFILSKRQGATDIYLDNVMLVKEKLNVTNNTLKKFAKSSERKIRSFVDGSKIVSTKDMKVKRKKYHRIEYTGDFPNASEGLRWISYYFVVEDEAYVLTATMDNSQTAIYKETLEEIMKSFKMKKSKK